jgi:hypothetical protein
VAAECEGSADKKKNRETLERCSWHFLHSSPKTEGCEQREGPATFALTLLRPWGIVAILGDCALYVRSWYANRGRSEQLAQESGSATAPCVQAHWRGLAAGSSLTQKFPDPFVFANLLSNEPIEQGE